MEGFVEYVFPCWRAGEPNALRREGNDVSYTRGRVRQEVSALGEAAEGVNYPTVVRMGVLVRATITAAKGGRRQGTGRCYTHGNRR